MILSSQCCGQIAGSVGVIGQRSRGKQSCVFKSWAGGTIGTSGKNEQEEQ